MACMDRYLKKKLSFFPYHKNFKRTISSLCFSSRRFCRSNFFHWRYFLLNNSFLSFYSRHPKTHKNQLNIIFYILGLAKVFLQGKHLKPKLNHLESFELILISEEYFWKIKLFCWCLSWLSHKFIYFKNKNFLNFSYFRLKIIKLKLIFS